jgi:methylated-DNA-protein-cysteine methyltransferase-like protein
MVLRSKAGATDNSESGRGKGRGQSLSVPRFYPYVYRVVAQVPRGKVVTYGQIAAILGVPRAARAVGTALRYLPQSLHRRIPWQRVINAQGGISSRGNVMRAEEQRWLLQDEGVVFDRHGRVDLKTYRWRGPQRAWRLPVWKARL